MTGGRHGRRVVVVHGPADPGLDASLRAAGFNLELEVDGTTVWTGGDGCHDRAAVGNGAPSPTASERRLLLTIGEAAAVLGVGRTTTYQLIATGELDVVHVGRATRVPAAALEELVLRLRDRRARPPVSSHRPDTLKLFSPTDASQRAAASQPSPS